MTPKHLLLIPLLAAMVGPCFSQNDTLPKRLRRTTGSFDFSEKIYLCPWRNAWPYDLHCILKELHLSASTYDLKLIKISHAPVKDTVVLFFESDSSGAYLECRNCGEIKHRYHKATNEVVPFHHVELSGTRDIDSSEWVEQQKPLKECLDENCVSFISREYWGNAALKFENGYFKEGDIIHEQYNEFDSLGNRTLMAQIVNDSILYSYYSEYLPNTSLISKQGDVISVHPREKSPYAHYKYNFDDHNNWIKREHYRSGELVETVKRVFIYSHQSLDISKESYDNLYVKSIYKEVLSIDGLSIIVDSKSNRLLARNKGNVEVWEIPAARFIGSENQLIEAIDTIYCYPSQDYNIVLKLKNGKWYYIKSKNGKFKRSK